MTITIHRQKIQKKHSKIEYLYILEWLNRLLDRQVSNSIRFFISRIPVMEKKIELPIGVVLRGYNFGSDFFFFFQLEHTKLTDEWIRNEVSALNELRESLELRVESTLNRKFNEKENM